MYEAMALTLQPSRCSVTTASRDSLTSGASWYDSKRRESFSGTTSSERTLPGVCLPRRLPVLT